MIDLFKNGHLLVAPVVCVQESSESVVGLAEDFSGRKGLVEETA